MVWQLRHKGWRKLGTSENFTFAEKIIRQIMDSSILRLRMLGRNENFTFAEK